MFLRSRRLTRVLPRPAAPPDRRRSDISSVSPLPVRSRGYRFPANSTGACLLLADADAPARTTPRARVGSRALAPDRHATTVAQPAIAPNVHQPLDVQRHLAAEVAFDPVFLVDDLSQAVDLFVGQITNSGIWIDPRALEKLLTGVESNAVDIRQRRLDTLLARKVDSGNSRHIGRPSIARIEQLSLALLVLRVRADHTNYAVPPDHLAFVAAPLNRCSNFHEKTSFLQ